MIRRNFITRILAATLLGKLLNIEVKEATAAANVNRSVD